MHEGLQEALTLSTNTLVVDGATIWYRALMSGYFCHAAKRPLLAQRPVRPARNADG
jgi:hypothetical protein